MIVIKDDSKHCQQVNSKLSDDARVIIYDRNMFIIQATRHFLFTTYYKTRRLCEELSCTDTSPSASVP